MARRHPWGNLPQDPWGLETKQCIEVDSVKGEHGGSVKGAVCRSRASMCWEEKQRGEVTGIQGV